MLYYTWQTTKKLVKSSKDVGENCVIFALDPKFEFGHLDSCFALRSKIHVFGSTILQVLLILIRNGNCVLKSLGLIWPVLEITSLKVKIQKNQIKSNENYENNSVARFS